MGEQLPQGVEQASKFLAENRRIISFLVVAGCVGFIVGYKLGDSNPPAKILPPDLQFVPAPAPCADCREAAIKREQARQAESAFVLKDSPSASSAAVDPPAPRVTAPTAEGEAFDHAAPAHGATIPGRPIEPS